MILLADYEGLEAGFGLLFGLIIMTLAFLLGVGGIVAGSMNPARQVLARWLGVAAFVLGVIAIGVALSGYWEERNHLNYYGKHFHPPLFLWLVSAATIGTSVVALCLGFVRRTGVKL